MCLSLSLSLCVCVCVRGCVCVWVVQGFFGVFGPRRDIVAFPQPFRETRKQIAGTGWGPGKMFDPDKTGIEKDRGTQSPFF